MIGTTKIYILRSSLQVPKMFLINFRKLTHKQIFQQINNIYHANMKLQFSLGDSTIG